MGQQQILLIVLSVILVGIAIAVGITMFQSQARQSNIDAMIADLNNLGSTAYSYRIRPTSMGGGGNSYVNFSQYFDALAPGMKANNNAAYTVVTAVADTVRIQGVSVQDSDIIRILEVGSTGTMTITIPD